MGGWQRLIGAGNRAARAVKRLTIRVFEAQEESIPKTQQGGIDQRSITLHEEERRSAYSVFESLWQTPPPPCLTVGPNSEDELVVVVCLWNRPQRIARILQLVDEQSGLGSRVVRLVLWNNNPRDHDKYVRAIQNFSPRGCLRRIELTVSEHNVRGVARFVAARRLVANGYTGPLITLDDDQEIRPDALAKLLRVYGEHGGQRILAGVWSWRSDTEDYWQRERAGNGQPANYVGTGGAIMDSAVFADNALCSELDPRGIFMEDIWLSRFSLARGWNLLGVEFDFEFVLDETNQGHGLVFDKLEYWQSLAHKWPIPSTHARITTNP